MLFSRDPRSRQRSELMGATANVLVGAVCLGCGLSGALLFMGFGESWPFTALGGFLIGVGGLRLWRWWARRRADARKEADAPR